MARIRRFSMIAALLLVLAPTIGHAAEPRVVTSLPPIHALVSRLLQGIATPELLMDKTLAPHLVALPGGKLQDLRRADLVIWSGPELEGAIAEAELVTPGLSRRLLTLSDRIPVLNLASTGNPDRPTGERDLRFWLDPRLAHHAVHVITPALVRLYPDATDTILDNEIALMREIHHVEHAIRAAVKREVGTPLHVGTGDMRYLEWRFNLAQQGCGRSGLDPLGFDLPPGPGLYGKLMDKARDALLTCQREKVASSE